MHRIRSHHTPDEIIASVADSQIKAPPVNTEIEVCVTRIVFRPTFKIISGIPHGQNRSTSPNIASENPNDFKKVITSEMEAPTVTIRPSLNTVSLRVLCIPTIESEEPIDIVLSRKHPDGFH